MKKGSLSRGFSLTELLVTIGILAIVGSVATVVVTSYTKTARQNALKKSLSKVESAFKTCMAFNGFNGSECNTIEKIAYKKGTNHRTKHLSDENDENICFELKGKGIRGCIQFQNGSILRKCLSLPGNISLKGDTNFRASCDKSNKGTCCQNCCGACEENYYGNKGKKGRDC